jgi:DNA-directed RNA polymerase subunit N (RpoN/RPB10)
MKRKRENPNQCFQCGKPPEFGKYVRKARRLARKYRAWIERVAKLLLEKRTLTDRGIPRL